MALAKLLPYQREDFVGIFQALKGLPATIRFLDPPLHEFLPNDAGRPEPAGAEAGRGRGEDRRSACTSCTSSTPCSASAAAASASTIPEISAMQARAVFEAAAQVQKEGIKVKPEVMIPLVGFKKELDLQVAIVHDVAARRSWPSRR